MTRTRGQRLKARKAKAFRRRVIALAAVVLVVVVAVVIYQLGRPAPEPEPDKVLLRTTMGDITIELSSDMPLTTANFRHLVKRGIYDNTIFHRVIDKFMIQGGEPIGTSIPTIRDEFSDHNRNLRGTVAMANTGQPNTGSSQFFINLVDNNHLDEKHPVFGRVIAGMSVVDAIGKVPTDEYDRPIEPVTIISAEMI